MKIGIITRPLTSNYGGILQNYALQKVLQNMGHDVWTIDYRKYTWLDWLDKAWRVIIYKILGKSIHFDKTPQEQIKEEIPLRGFVNRYIKLTTPRTRKIERNIVCKYGFDAIVVGSDQVWNPRYSKYIQRYFLSFIKNQKIKRIAYAASFGVDKWTFTERQTKICSKLATCFNAISVRELSGIKLCKNYLGVDSVNVLDPTLLLYASDYCDLCKNIPKQNPFVFAYILDESVDKLAVIKNFAHKKGLPYFIKSAGEKVDSNDSVELWLSYFRDAEFIITDSFHGTAFSINFNKDFFVFENSKRGNSRFDSLLGNLGLMTRIINSSDIDDTNKIDWEKTNEIREELLIESIKWLEQSL